MLTRRLLGMGILVVTLLGSAGCGAAAGGAGAPATGTAASAPVASAAAPTAQVQSSDEGVVAAPASGQTGSSQAPGQTDPGAGSGEAGATADATGTEPAQTGPMTTYTDSTYQFRIDHPADFVVRPLEAAALRQLVPQPVAGFAFLSPTRAASDLGAMEAADLELRVLDAGGSATIEDWLSAGAATAGGGQTRPFQAAGASGVEVCSDTLMGPGCSYYFLSGVTVYQLIPASLEGETMLKSFTPGAP